MAQDMQAFAKFVTPTADIASAGAELNTYCFADTDNLTTSALKMPSS